MPSISSFLFLILIAKCTTASFIIANTTSCYGEFFVGACFTSVQVISPGVDFNESFTCDKLHHAQSARYIKAGTAGPHSSNFTSTGDVCGEGRLYSQRNNTETSTNGTFDIFKGSDASGDSIGQCEYTGANITESKRRCSQLMGTIFFEGAYHCNTSVCGDNDSTPSFTAASTTSTTSLYSTMSSSTTTDITATLSSGSATSSTTAGSGKSSASSSATSSTPEATETTNTDTQTTSPGSTSSVEATTTGNSKRNVHEQH
ncbi:hypothetical protein CLAFUW4_05794 [Fulvia fulva]|uniref:Uncharacterized protein n=1 Tax=Passalora fulva TaxID=5499 RepID=A0A9Q8LIN3_PASFU|nr:uncharacterized protein CLAFUR5_05935 [Fulvia fulva]KAK4624598.1 hypothetical protein CLAFUR4_05788 [Fulvia fulva]KAK4624799.1 hypothetical protein CLAFUR0_05799 [Fulvia fulva]UJO18184.1 hypothetical protein CLAFUR5_05935 [Fulvia fulva]WPV14770.1 hypothetical protein CLAFUW4_05794 [Fulvia fulva]WPV30274.1 hypothetical protein CLAFUW7_05792 [Fulvia fulva]